ncbi:site-specific integrase [Nocardioides marmoraquaticus]
MSGKTGGRQAGRPKRSGLVVSSEELQVRVDAEPTTEAAPLADHPPADRYPERLMPIAGVDGLAGADSVADDAETAALRARYERFCAIREDILLDYGYNTARAYWGDLDDIFLWCEHRRFDMFELSDRQFRDYLGLLRRRKYSESTIRRRGTALRKFRAALPRGRPLEGT